MKFIRNIVLIAASMLCLFTSASALTEGKLKFCVKMDHTDYKDRNFIVFWSGKGNSDDKWAEALYNKYIKIKIPAGSSSDKLYCSEDEYEFEFTKSNGFINIAEENGAGFNLGFGLCSKKGLCASKSEDYPKLKAREDHVFGVATQLSDFNSYGNKSYSPCRTGGHCGNSTLTFFPDKVENSNLTTSEPSSIAKSIWDKFYDIE